MLQSRLMPFSLCSRFKNGFLKYTIDELMVIIMTLDELGIGKSASVVSVGGEGALRQHFLDMGIIPEAQLTLVKFAPMGDPIEFLIHGYELTLRLDDAKKIETK